MANDGPVDDRRRQTIEDLLLELRLRREMDDRLLRGLSRADARLSIEGRGAWLFTQTHFSEHVRELAALEQSLGRFHFPAPDQTLHRGTIAIAGLDEGLIDPLVEVNDEQRRRVVDAEEDKHHGISPGTGPNELLDRATAAGAMHILHKNAGRKRPVAALEVANPLADSRLLAKSKGKSGPGKVVERWRDEINKQAEKRDIREMRDQNVDDPRTLAAGHYNYLINEAQRELVSRGIVNANEQKAFYERLAHTLVANLSQLTTDSPVASNPIPAASAAR